MQELSNAEKDLIILGMICCSINATPLTITAKQHNDWRKSSRIKCFYHEHRRICRDTFLYLMEIRYLAWRIATGRHTTIALHFMMPGHTKFAPDWCFGLLKRRLRRTRVSCLDDIQRVVTSSSVVNSAQLVGNETGEVTVPTYDWARFFTPVYRKVVGVKRHHHFVLTAAKPGIVSMQELCEGPAKELLLLKGQIPDGMPDVIRPAGLSQDRQTDLSIQ